MADSFSEQWITIGKILSVYGTSGAVKVFPYTDFPERCSQLKTVLLQNASLCQRKLVDVENAVIYGRLWLIKFKSIDSREKAAQITGFSMLIDPAERYPLPPGSYYFDQIIGLEVLSPEGVLLGHIVEIISTGAHDLYVVQEAAGEGKQLLLPAVRRFITKIDLERGAVIAQFPDGLADL